MDVHEYHTAMAASAAQSFYSLRQVEWQIAFQAYAGYAAIAVAFHTLQPTPENPNAIVARVAICSVLFVFAVTVYASLRILERMHKRRELEKFHIEKIRLAFASDERSDSDIPDESKAWKFWFKPHKEPIHPYWYAFLSQLSINIASVIGIIAFVIYRVGLRTLAGC